MTGCQNHWCVTSNATSSGCWLLNSAYTDYIGSSEAPGGGIRSMHLSTSCHSNQGGVYQDLTGLEIGTQYRLTWESSGGSWSPETDFGFATMSDVTDRSNIWSQHFYEAPLGSWTNQTLDFVAYVVFYMFEREARELLSQETQMHTSISRKLTSLCHVITRLLLYHSCRLRHSLRNSNANAHLNITRTAEQ